MQYELSRVLDGSRWLMQPAAFRAMVTRIAKTSPEAMQAAIVAYSDDRAPSATLVGDVAVIAASGPILYKSSWVSRYLGGTSIEDLQRQFRAALADPAARLIVFKWDSPGGTVEMVPEFADELFAARGQKPIYSVADTLIASAAYWLAAQTDVIYATGSSELGSVGAYCQHEDVSGMLEQLGIKITLIAHGEHKVDGNPYEPLSDTAQADYQAYVDEVGVEFEAAVARGRGVTKKAVVETFGQGLIFRGKKAIALGVADKLGTFNQVLARLTKGRSTIAAAAHEIVVDDSHVHEGTTVLDALAASDAARREPLDVVVTAAAAPGDDGVEPIDGACADGYELDDEDGLCHPVDEADAKAKAAADQEALNIALTLGRV